MVGEEHDEEIRVMLKRLLELEEEFNKLCDNIEDKILENMTQDYERQSNE